MMRESMIPGSKYAFVGISGDGYFRCQTRAATSANSSLTTVRGGTPGAWLRLVRTGKTVTSYRSLDGLTWARLTSANVPMATNIYVGIVVASGNVSSMSETTFSSPTVVP
jgi:regulation of enolase protein 1 (concanavalin A-like superfamily)